MSARSRSAKIAMTLSLAAFAFLVAFTDITDDGSNFAFVQLKPETDAP